MCGSTGSRDIAPPARGGGEQPLALLSDVPDDGPALEDLDIRAYGPVAASGAAELMELIRAARLNDPSAEATLRALKELHEALGALIAGAEAAAAPHRLRVAWEAVEKAKGKLIDAMSGGAQAILVAPVVAYGTATVLSLLSGQPVTGEMLAILAGAVMARHSLAGKEPQACA